MGKIFAYFVAIIFGTASVALAADNEKESWFGKQLKRASDFIARKMHDLLSDVITALKGFSDTVKGLISDAWEGIRNFFDWAVNWAKDIWQWLKLTFEIFLGYLNWLYEKFWCLLRDLYYSACNWVLEWVWWFIKREFEIFVGYVDWLMDFSLWMFEKILSILPPIELPKGFEQGLAYFVEYGMVLNKMLPLEEALYLFELYIVIYIAVIVHGFVKGWWRWIGWFNK